MGHRQNGLSGAQLLSLAPRVLYVFLGIVEHDRIFVCHVLGF